MQTRVGNLNDLTRINLDDLFKSFGVAGSRLARSLLTPFFWLPARKFAKEVLDYDDGVASLGLQGGANRLLINYVHSLKVIHPEHVPSTGPVLILANHPGMTDTVALFASIPRTDLKIIAAERPFLEALPATRQHLSFVPEGNDGRLDVVRSIAAHLRSGGAALTFPAGQIEPDPAVMPSAVQSLDTWSQSIGLFIRLVPEAMVVPAIVSGVIAAPSLRHPLTRLRRNQRDRERMAASLQILVKELAPGHWPVDVRVTFSSPIPASQLAPLHDPTAITRAFLEKVRPLVEGIQASYTSPSRITWKATPGSSASMQ